MARIFAAHRLSLPLMILTSMLVAGPACAGWLDAGNPVCTAAGNQYFPSLVPDGDGRAILVWQDYRTPAGNVFTSLVEPGGSVDWLSGGLPASLDGEPREFFGRTVPDGEGGVYMVWTDHLAGNADIFAQRIGADGQRDWSDYGAPVALTASEEMFPSVAALEGGGIAVAWRESSSSGALIRVQILGPDGTARWSAGGLVASQSAESGPPAVASDGAGGAVVFWPAGSPVGSSVRAQRFSAAGAAQWGAPAIEVCSGSRVSGQLGIAGSGDISIWWQDNRAGSSDIYAQRTDAEGTALWGSSGLCVCEGDADQWQPAGILSAGELILAWSEGTGGDYGIKAQKIGAGGTRSWGAGGVDVCTASSYQLNPDLAPDGTGGAVIVWQDLRGSDYDVYSQRLGFDGSLIWDETGMPVTAAPGDQCLPRAAADSEGGAFVAWEDWTSESNILCQRVMSDGSIVGTAVAQFSAVIEDFAVEVEWTLQAGDDGEHDFIISKAEGGGEYAVMSGVEVALRYPAYSFVDTEVVPESEYSYRVGVVEDGKTSLLFETGSIKVPGAATTLEQNWPNPFNPSTTITFVLSEGRDVSLAIYDASGREVATLADGYYAGGRHEIHWNGSDGTGEPVSSGVYFYRLAAGKDILTRKMILLR